MVDCFQQQTVQVVPGMTIAAVLVALAKLAPRKSAQTGGDLQRFVLRRLATGSAATSSLQ